MIHATKPARRRVLPWLLALLLLSLATTQAAASSQDFAMSRYTVDGGGGSSQGGNFALTGTIGQFDAAVSQGGDFVLVGGFWGGFGAGEQRLYLPALRGQ
jgi:hypothetical protein